MSEAKTTPSCICPPFRRSAIQGIVQTCLNCGTTIVSPIGARSLLAESDARVAELESRIAEALEFCEDREDIVDGENGPLPNLAMQVATILKGRVA